VGLPVAIAALQILNGKIKTPGVQLPITKEVYLPILNELEDYGVVLKSNRCHTLVISQIEFFSLVLVKQIRL
jgi:hypothetical protein